MTVQMPSAPGAVVMPEPAVHDDEIRSAASLLTFFALAFAWSWACWLLAAAIKADAPVAATVLSLVGGFGPSLAAVVVMTYCAGKAGLRRWLMTLEKAVRPSESSGKPALAR